MVLDDFPVVLVVDADGKGVTVDAPRPGVVVETEMDDVVVSSVETRRGGSW